MLVVLTFLLILIGMSSLNRFCARWTGLLLNTFNNRFPFNFCMTFVWLEWIHIYCSHWWLIREVAVALHLNTLVIVFPFSKLKVFFIIMSMTLFLNRFTNNDCINHLRVWPIVILLLVKVYCLNRFRSILSIMMAISITWIHAFMMISFFLTIKIDGLNSFRALSFILINMWWPNAGWMLISLVLITKPCLNAAWSCLIVSIVAIIAISSIYSPDGLRAFPSFILITVHYFTSSIQTSWVFISIKRIHTWDLA